MHACVGPIDDEDKASRVGFDVVGLDDAPTWCGRTGLLAGPIRRCRNIEANLARTIRIPDVEHPYPRVEVTDERQLLVEDVGETLVRRMRTRRGKEK